MVRGASRRSRECIRGRPIYPQIPILIRPPPPVFSIRTVIRSSKWGRPNGASMAPYPAMMGCAADVDGPPSGDRHRTRDQRAPIAVLAARLPAGDPPGRGAATRFAGDDRISAKEPARTINHLPLHPISILFLVRQGAAALRLGVGREGSLGPETDRHIADG